MEKEKKIDAGEYGAATIPRDELVDAYRYFEWKKSGQASGEPPPPLHKLTLPPLLHVQAWEASGSLETWIRSRIEAEHKFRNARPVMPHPVLQGIDDEMEKAYAEAFAECQKYYEDLSKAMKIAENVFRDVLMEKVYLPDDISFRLGEAHGKEQLKPLYDDLKKTERKLAAARRKSEQAQGKVEEMERELAEKAAVISRIRSAREFLKKCRDAAKLFYYKGEKTHNLTAAARHVMAQPWFKSLIEIHNNVFVPRESSASAIGKKKESLTDSIRKHLERWKKANWKLPFEG